MIETINTIDYEEWREWREARAPKRGKQLSGAAFNRPLTYLSHCLKTAKDKGVIDYHFFEKLVDSQGKPNWKEDENRSRNRILDKSEREELIKAINNRDFVIRHHITKLWSKEFKTPKWQDREGRVFMDYLEPMVRVAMTCGLRRGELFTLKWSNIKWDETVIEVESANAKNRASRRVTMVGGALHVLKTWYEDKGSPPADHHVFPSPKSPKCGPTIELYTIQTAWRNVVKQAGLDKHEHGFKFHDLRHVAGTDMASAGLPEAEIRKMMGHKTSRMSDIYINYSDKHRSPFLLRYMDKSPDQDNVVQLVAGS